MIDPEWLKIASHEMLVGAGVRVLLHSWVVAAITDGDEVKGAIFESKQGRRAILAKVVVDATGDLDVFAQAGGAYVTDSETDGKGGNVQHCINTAFTWSGVDFTRWLEFKQGDPQGYRDFMARGGEAMGYVETPHVGWRDDVVVFMGPRLTGYSGLDVEHLSAVELESRRRMVSHLDFFRRHAPGFERAWIMLAAPQMGIRMTRRLAGLHAMTMDDWRGGRPPRRRGRRLAVAVAEDRERSRCPTARSSRNGSTGSSSAAATWPATPRRSRSCARSRSAG